MTRLRAAVIGLGRVGSRFDEEPGRRSVWTHVGAYLQRPELFDLVAASDSFGQNAEMFCRRCPSVPVFDDAVEMLQQSRPDVVSICTPIDSHASLVALALTEPSVKAVWCEKPLAHDLASAETMVDDARSRGVYLIVSHVRRWTPLWQEAAQIARSGRIGTVRSVRVAMPNRLATIGSHAIDLALLLGGRPIRVQGLAVPDLAEEGEPAVVGSLLFESGAYGLIQVTGLKTNLCVEAEVFGDEGRMRVLEGPGEIRIDAFQPSVRYDGYRELACVERFERSALEGASPFVAIAEEIDQLVNGQRRDLTCSGSDALEVQRVLELMSSAARS